MRISSLRVDGFGIFHEQEASGFAPGLNLFLGDNEAGKSTLLGFIRAVLFGFPRANSRDPSYPPLAGGVHGGRINVVTSGGRTFAVERKPGKGGGEVTVSGPTGSEGSDDTLQQLLAGITYEAFRNVYAFSLSELQTLESLRAESVKSVIYGAAAGAAIMALPRAEKSLQERLDSLFRTSGSKPLINRKLGELEDLARRLREASAGGAEYDTSCSKLAEIDQQIGELRQDLSRVVCEKETLNRYLSVLPDFHQLQADERSLAELDELVDSFPSEGLLRLEKMTGQLDQLDTQRAESEQRVAHLQDKLSQIVVNEPILREAESIRLLLENRRDFMAKVNRLPVEERQRQSLDESLSHGIASLGSDWSVDKVLAADRSIFTQETILRHQKGQLGIEKECASAMELLSERKRQLTEAEEAERGAEAAVNSLGEPPSSDEDELLARLEQGRTEFASAVRDLPHRQIELKQERKSLSNALREIDPKWTEREALEFDLSLAARSRVVQFDNTLRSQEADLQQAKALLSVKDQAYQAHCTSIEQIDVRIESLRPASASVEDLDQRKRTAGALRGFLTKKRELDQELAHLRERLADKTAAINRVAAPLPGAALFRPLAITFGAIGIILPLSLLLLGKNESAVIVLLAAALLIAVVVYFGRWLSPSAARPDNEQSRESLSTDARVVEASLARAQEQAAEVSSSIKRLGGQLGFEGGVTVETVEKAEEDIETDQKLRDRRQSLVENRTQLEKERELSRAELEKAQREVEKEGVDLATTQQQWTAFVEGAGMSATLPPTVINAVFGKIETVRQRIEAVRSLESRIEKIKNVINDYRGIALKILPASAPPPESSQDFTSQVDRILAERRALKELHSVASRSLADKRREVAQALKGSEEAKKKLKEAEKRQVEACASWQRSLADQGLPADLSPETATQALNRVDECIRQITGKNKLDLEIRSLREDIDRYQSELLMLQERLGRPAPAADRIVPTVDQLVAELETQKENTQSRADLQEQLQDAAAGLKNLQERIEREKSGLQALLEEAGAVDTEDFRRKHDLYSQRKALLASISTAERRLRSAGSGLALAEIEETLAALRQEDIPGQIRELEDRGKDVESRLEDLRRTRAEIQQLIKSLSSSDEVARLRLEEERLLTELRGSAMSWAKLAMARDLIRKAKKIYEQQQQPKVVREAEGFFSRFTGGKYTNLFAPIGEETIEVIEAGNARKKPEALSRGTAEQLYLAIRFGYIKSRAENAESLPIVMDDILVNFDPSRCRWAAEAILELASAQQILFFTCHPETVDRFTSCGSEVPIWEIKEGRIERRAAA
jgi:uncharacterized protein YhaN